MIINFGFGKYTYKIFAIILACILSEKIMAKASKFLRESELNEELKNPPKRKPPNKNNTS